MSRARRFDAAEVTAPRARRLRELVGALGARGVIRFIRDTVAGPWL